MLRLKSLLRFNLRAFFLAVTLFLVWLSIHVHRANVQVAAIKEINKYQSRIRYDFQYPTGDFSDKGFDANAQSAVPTWLSNILGVDFFHSVVDVYLDGGDGSHDCLVHVANLSDLRSLAFSETPATDSCFPHLRTLRKLERLILWDASEITDSGISNLRGMNRLQFVFMKNPNITDESMKIFAGLRSLEHLSLQDSKFTDRGLEYIGRSKRLRYLTVGMGPNSISDAGLVHLQGLRELEILGIQKTAVTDKGIQQLRTLPRLKKLLVSPHVTTDGLHELRRSNPRPSMFGFVTARLRQSLVRR